MSNTYYTKWSWDELNKYSQSTLEEISKAYNAVTNNGLCSDFGYVVWNDIVRLVNETMILSGYGWQTSNQYSDETVISYENTLLSEEDKVLTAKRFNAIRFQIDRFKEWFWEYDETAKGYIGRKSFLGAADVSVDVADKIYGAYFLELTTAINEMIDELEKCMISSTVELNLQAVSILINGESNLCQSYIKLQDSLQGELSLSIPIPLNDDRMYEIILSVIASLTTDSSISMESFLNEIQHSSILNASPSNSVAYSKDIALNTESNIDTDMSAEMVYQKLLTFIERVLADIDPSVSVKYENIDDLSVNTKGEVDLSVDIKFINHDDISVNVKAESVSSVENVYKNSLGFTHYASLYVRIIRMFIYKVCLDFKIMANLDVNPSKSAIYKQSLGLEVIRNLTVHLAAYLVCIYQINMALDAYLNTSSSVEQLSTLIMTLGSIQNFSVDISKEDYINEKLAEEISVIFLNGTSNSMFINDSINIGMHLILNTSTPNEMLVDNSVELDAVFKLLNGTSQALDKLICNMYQTIDATLSLLDASNSIAEEEMIMDFISKITVWLMPIKENSILKIRQAHTIEKVNTKLYIK